MSDENNYPALTSMGVQNPQQIVSYSIYPVKDTQDVLSIRYARPKGSFLPVVKRYRMGRQSKAQMVDSGTRQTTMVSEISPILLQAQQELEKIVNTKLSQQEVKQQITQELDRMENEFRAEIAHLKQMLDKLD